MCPTFHRSSHAAHYRRHSKPTSLVKAPTIPANKPSLFETPPLTRLVFTETATPRRQPAIAEMTNQAKADVVRALAAPGLARPAVIADRGRQGSIGRMHQYVRRQLPSGNVRGSIRPGATSVARRVRDKALENLVKIRCRPDSSAVLPRDLGRNPFSAQFVADLHKQPPPDAPDQLIN